MSIYEANSIPPHHVRSHIHSRAATSTSYLLFTCSSSWNRQQTISYILKNISYPALLPSTFPRPKTRKKSSPCRIVSTFENGAFDAPPRSIILSARQSRRDWVGGEEGESIESGESPFWRSAKTARFSAVVFDISNTRNPSSQLMRARAYYTRSHKNRPCLPSPPSSLPLPHLESIQIKTD